MKIRAEHSSDDIYILRIEDGGYIGIAMREASLKWFAFTHYDYVANKKFGEHDNPKALADVMTTRLSD